VKQREVEALPSLRAVSVDPAKALEVLESTAAALLEVNAAAAARLPASVDSPQSKRIIKTFKKAMQGYFSRLLKSLPLSSITKKASAIGAKAPKTDTGRIPDNEMPDLRKKLAPLFAKSVGAKSDDLEETLVAELIKPFILGSKEAGKAAKQQIKESGVDDDVPEWILEWAKNYSAALVTGLDETSIIELAGIVAQGLQDQVGVSGLGDLIREKFPDISIQRSELIAATETSNALSAGAEDAAKKSGSTHKEWVTVGDDRVDEEICEANEAQGRIPIGQPFQSGHSHTPGHPQCRCVTVYYGASK